jgi:hypothetical protein
VPEWWQQAYPGGPMIAVKGFPRPLYPPDAAPGHKPSVDGSDVEGYKRTISRAGRWQWQAFDQAFSNGFSHGKSPGNVGETGVAGVQRQARIQPTGWVGKETFNLLRSIRIPSGLPHAGEPAMDARSVELINAAWDRFGGKEPSAGGSSSAQARLAKARGQLGYAEGANNANKFGEWYGANGQPWCAMFVTWCDLTGSAPSTKSFKRGSRYAYVPYILADARLGYYGLSCTSSPKPGDLVLYDWSWDGEYDHVGVFEQGSASSWQAVEGNTSPSSSGSQSNGGGVYRRSRDKGDAAVVFVRVAE